MGHSGAGAFEVGVSHSNAVTPAVAARRKEKPMSDATRRTFLAAAGTSAAAAAAVAAAPAAVAGAASSTPDPDPGHIGDRLVAYVEDARSGRLSVMYGENEVTINDADLVRHLARVARG